MRRTKPLGNRWLVQINQPPVNTSSCTRRRPLRATPVLHLWMWPKLVQLNGRMAASACVCSSTTQNVFTQTCQRSMTEMLEHLFPTLPSNSDWWSTPRRRWNPMYSPNRAEDQHPSLPKIFKTACNEGKQVQDGEGWQQLLQRISAKAMELNGPGNKNQRR